MGAEDFVESEVAIAAMATAAALSPRARDIAKQGAVYGLAGVMTVGGAVVGAARGVGQGAQRMVGAGPSRPTRSRAATVASPARTASPRAATPRTASSRASAARKPATRAKAARSSGSGSSASPAS